MFIAIFKIIIWSVGKDISFKTELPIPTHRIRTIIPIPQFKVRKEIVKEVHIPPVVSYDFACVVLYHLRFITVEKLSRERVEFHFVESDGVVHLRHGFFGVDFLRFHHLFGIGVNPLGVPPARVVLFFQLREQRGVKMINVNFFVFGTVERHGLQMHPVEIVYDHQFPVLFIKSRIDIIFPVDTFGVFYFFCDECFWMGRGDLAVVRAQDMGDDDVVGERKQKEDADEKFFAVPGPGFSIEENSENHQRQNGRDENTEQTQSHITQPFDRCKRGSVP